MYTNVASTDFDYLTVFDVIPAGGPALRPGIRPPTDRRGHDRGRRRVWSRACGHFNDQPVRLKFIMRVEDERREVGDLIRAALQDAGFAIAANRQTFAPAIQTVYASDPAQFEWHLYTEGWGRGAPNRYDFGGINSFYAPWLGNMPGWKEVGFWHYENEELDELGERLFKGDFDNQAKRDEMYREMTRIGLDESVRIWIATVMNAFPVQAGIEGVTQDLAARPARGCGACVRAYRPDSDELDRRAIYGCGPNARPGIRSVGLAMSTATISGGSCRTPPYGMTPLPASQRPSASRMRSRRPGRMARWMCRQTPSCGTRSGAAGQKWGTR